MQISRGGVSPSGETAMEELGGRSIRAVGCAPGQGDHCGWRENRKIGGQSIGGAGN